MAQQIPSRQCASIQAHYDFLAKHHRDTGVRARLCSSGCYSLSDANGHFNGRTASEGKPGNTSASNLKTTASCMAHSEELLSACRAIDSDFEKTGTVSCETIALIRNLLGAVAAA